MIDIQYNYVRKGFGIQIRQTIDQHLRDALISHRKHRMREADIMKVQDPNIHIQKAYLALHSANAPEFSIGNLGHQYAAHEPLQTFITPSQP